MKRERSKPLPSRQKAELEALAHLPEKKIGTEKIPEVKDWSGARRGLLYRPVKKQLTLRLDADVVEWFKEHAPKGVGYQTNINRALRAYVVGRHRKSG